MNEHATAWRDWFRHTKYLTLTDKIELILTHVNDGSWLVDVRIKLESYDIRKELRLDTETESWAEAQEEAVKAAKPVFLELASTLNQLPDQWLLP